MASSSFSRSRWLTVVCTSAATVMPTPMSAISSSIQM
ncbi:hypothetical protein QF040_004526 [Variovorax sp. W2I14]